MIYLSRDEHAPEPTSTTGACRREGSGGTENHRLVDEGGGVLLSPRPSEVEVAGAVDTSCGGLQRTSVMTVSLSKD